MLTLPFRLAGSLFIALFFASSLFRRAVAGVAVSAAIVAAQHEQVFSALAATEGQSGLGAIAAFAALLLG